jgi:hypothetical protein
MTLEDFRHIALSLPGVEELNGLGHPIFLRRAKEVRDH